MKIKTSFKRLLLAGLTLSMLSVGLVGGAVFADEEVPTGAEVTAGNTPPTIECKWELPDMDSSVPGIQYQSSPGSHDHDDDMVNDLGGVLPSTHPDRFPCQGPETGELPNQPDEVHNMISVRPNAEDDPEEVRVQLWSAIDHENGLDAISDVYWKVYHPDGSFKVQVHANEDYNGGVVRADNSDTSACTDWGNYNVDDSMFHAAYATGQVSSAAIDDVNNGLISLCQQEVKAFYYSEFEISKHQPCGEYKVELHAVSNGAESVLTNYIDVVCFYDLWIDFDGVNWGNIQPGVDKNIAGDLDPNTPNRPTVKNRGNHGMFIGVHFSEMVQQGTDGGKVIDLFDAAFGRTPSTILHLDPIPASTVAWFDDDPATNEDMPLSDFDQLLCSNEFGKLDLSIHPPSTLPAGTYTGSVQVLAKAAGELGGDAWNECLNRFHGTSS